MQFEKTKTYQNLASSFAGECQAGMRYQMIAKLAMQEKYKTLSDAIKTIAKNETLHATQFFNMMIEKIEVMDLSGRMLMSFENANNINIESLPIGTYYLLLHLKDKAIMRKIVKQ